MGDMIFKPLIEDMTWSYSRVKLFEDCPYKWFMRYIHGIEEDRMFYASFGAFVHELIEKYYAGEIKKEALPVRYITGFYKNVALRGAEESTIEKYLLQGFEYFKHFKEFPFEPVAVEKTIDFSLGGHPFTCRLDFLGRDESGLCIVDHKARDLKPRGKRKKPLASDKVLDNTLEQLYVYSSAVRAEYGEYPSKLCLNCYRTGVFIEEPFDESVHDRVIEKILKTIETIENEDEWLPSIDWFYCRSMCGLNRDCEFHRR